MEWYAVHTHPRGEITAQHHLSRQGFKVYLPLYLKRRTHARRVDFVKTPLFPRYMFVSGEVGRTRWRSISSTVGVSNLVCFGDKPALVPDEIIRTIQETEDEKGLVVLGKKRPPRSGEVVEILHSGFSEIRAVVEQLDASNRVSLLLEVLGRQVKMSVPLEKVTVSN